MELSLTPNGPALSKLNRKDAAFCANFGGKCETEVIDLELATVMLKVEFCLYFKADCSFRLRLGPLQHRLRVE